MKKILIIPLLVVLSSCSYKYAVISMATSFDYSEYTKSGFFITESNTLNKDYDPVASIVGECRSGYGILDVKKPSYLFKSSNDGTGALRIKYGEYIEATPEDALRLLVEKAKDLGANGVINLKIVPLLSIKGDGVTQPHTYMGPGFSASAMAIRIK